MTEILMRPIGRLASELRSTLKAPKQGDEGGVEAWLELAPGYGEALAGILVGDSVVILTWLHEARRDLLAVHPRGDTSQPMKGVFATRSPHRPNLIGIHSARVLQIAPDRMKVGPIEAIDGTPVLDVKISLRPEE